MSLRQGAAVVAASRQRLHGTGQFGAQHCKRGGIGRALCANHEIDGGKVLQHVTSQNLTQAAPQPIAIHGRRLMERDDEPETCVTRRIVTPDQIEMSGTLTTSCIPAGRELRAARDTYAARIPFARLPAPVFGWNANDELLAALLAPAGQRGAAPNGFHPRAEAMLVDAFSIPRPICRTHKFLV
jgi:hypothetical protein